MKAVGVKIEIRLSNNREATPVTTILKIKLVFSVLLAYIGLGLNLAQTQTKFLVMPMGSDAELLQNVITGANNNL
jgi:hypothetical protein